MEPIRPPLTIDERNHLLKIYESQLPSPKCTIRQIFNDKSLTPKLRELIIKRMNLMDSPDLRYRLTYDTESIRPDLINAINSLRSEFLPSSTETPRKTKSQEVTLKEKTTKEAEKALIDDLASLLRKDLSPEEEKLPQEKQEQILSKLNKTAKEAAQKYLNGSLPIKDPTLKNDCEKVLKKHNNQNLTSLLSKCQAFLNNPTQNNLDLSGLNLTFIPSFIFQPPFSERLTHLDISGNALLKVPSDIQNCSKLQNLNLSNNTLPEDTLLCIDPNCFELPKSCTIHLDSSKVKTNENQIHLDLTKYTNQTAYLMHPTKGPQFKFKNVT